MRLARCVSVALVCFVAASSAAYAQQPFYRKTRLLDITGKNPRDSIVLVATGPRADQLKIAMTFYVNGTPAHMQQWGSVDELDGQDSLKSKTPPSSQRTCVHDSMQHLRRPSVSRSTRSR